MFLPQSLIFFFCSHGDCAVIPYTAKTSWRCKPYYEDDEKAEKGGDCQKFMNYTEDLRWKIRT